MITLHKDSNCVLMAVQLYIEKMCDFYSRIGETKFTVLRHTNIYGPHDKFDLERSHVFGATITKVLSSKNQKVSVWGTGEEERDLLYIDDLVDFIDNAIKNQKSMYGLYNCGYGSAFSIRTLVEKIISASGKNLTKPSISPNPARRMGTITIVFDKSFPKVFVSGV